MTPSAALLQRLSGGATRPEGAPAKPAVAAATPPRLDLLDHLFLIDALILRDLSLKYRTDGVGFALDFLRPALIMIGHYYFFVFLNRSMPGNMPIETFVLGGFAVLFGFVLTMGGVVEGAKWPGGAILIPGITRMHLRVAKAAWPLLSILILALGSVILLRLFGDDRVAVSDLPLFLLVFAMTGLMAFGFGLIVEGMTRFWPATKLVQQIVTTVLYISSGMYFSLATIPPQLARIFWYSPTMHLVEYQRHAFDPGYPIAFASLSYPAAVTAGLLLVGLALNRCLRRLDRE
jgi:capsular polysaccharide transport system permease protein